MDWFDTFFERSSRTLAARTSRRSFLGRLGIVVAGGMAIPLLPVARLGEAQAAVPGAHNDTTQCDYWAYCGVDGVLCACCGGSASMCPPGSQPSPISWIGTCKNPGDGKLYVISYNDCCGASGCGECFCNRNEGDTPRYRPQRANSITWCHGGVSPTYHCTVSRVISLAD